jgi:phosphoribosylanthranilate isomerase
MRADSESPVWVKICGVCSEADAEVCVEAGADAIGLNFWKSSPRYCVEAEAKVIARTVAGRVVRVGVFVDASVDQIRALLDADVIDLAQLHGNEPPDDLRALGPRAFKAVALAGPDALAQARAWGSSPLLIDASVPGRYGGTGRTADWGLAAQLSALRSVILAGGLTAANVGPAIDRVRPYGVDTASGVERHPGRKDPALVKAFVAEAKGRGRP